MSEELRRLSDPAAWDVQLSKIGSYTVEPFECIPLFKLFIEVVAAPKFVVD